MSTSVLVINCGSSSIKYALVSERREDRIFGLAENLGSADARIKGITAGGQPLELSIPHADHEKALETILERLSHYNPQAIGHRVVHGGTLTKAELLTEEIVERKWLYLIQHSTKPCLHMLIAMLCQNFYTLSIMSVAMASTVRAMLMCLNAVQNWQVASNKEAG